MSVDRINFVTDDPWNPAYTTKWFLRALPHYDHVFTPREANLDDLRATGCKRVSYLPFAYAPSLHFPEEPCSKEERREFGCDVLFVGGGDQDRLPWIAALQSSGLDIGLYGGYWEQYRATRSIARGILDPERVRRAVGVSKVSMALVRRANRDGHSMRSYELPAMGACLLAEDTVDHRMLFGGDGNAVTYFTTPGELVEKVQWLLSDDRERERMAETAHELVVNGSNTYADRLAMMLELHVGKE
jgi:hypothetical protein